MKQSTKNLDELVKRYILDNVDGAGYGVTITSDREAIQFLKDTFYAEYGFFAARDGEHKALAEWLKGLPSAINLPFYNYAILEFAVQTGSLEPDYSERQADKILENYWDFMANKIGQMFRGYRLPKSPKYDKTYCSQCGQEFGPGDCGYSHCENHIMPNVELTGSPASGKLGSAK